MSLTDIFKINAFKSRISELEQTVTSLNKKIEELYSDLSTERGKLSAANLSIAQKEDFIHSRLPLFDTEKLTAQGNFDYFQNLWANSWGFNIHDRGCQLERQERSKHRCYSPLSLDATTGTGVFRGKDADYQTSLVRCDCTDFQRRAMPCKHMYRLAYELDVFMLDDVEYDPNIKSYPHVYDLASSVRPLSRMCKDILHECCYNTVYVANRAQAKPLLTLNLVVISNDKTTLLESYSKDDLYNLLADVPGVKRSLRKSDLISLIVSEHPDVISELEKLNVPLELSPYISHLTKELLSYIAV